MAHTAQPVSVLVVEDDPAVVTLMEVALESAGYRVVTAPNGAVALAVIAVEHPALILTDMRMPVMDGWAFVAAYRTSPAPHAPVLVMTGDGDAEACCAQVGADGWLNKPFTVLALLSLVAQHVKGAL
jgi:CheY-like chemotaxis protein